MERSGTDRADSGQARLIRAVFDGLLTRGFGIKRLTDLPMLWSEQWSAVGLIEPIQAKLG